MDVSKPHRAKVRYPDCNHKPMTEDTEHNKLCGYLYWLLAWYFQSRADVFVGEDLFWYAVEGQPRRRVGPDVMVVFGRPTQYRGSYMQWREEGIAPQVVFEITSPGNRRRGLLRKRRFYQQYGVEEYYLYRPSRNVLEVWLRRQDSEGRSRLRRLREPQGFVSPRMRTRFDLSTGELVLWGPGNERLLLPTEAFDERTAALDEVLTLREQVDDAEDRADDAEERLEQVERERDDAEERIRALEAFLRQRGLSPPE